MEPTAAWHLTQWGSLMMTTSSTSMVRQSNTDPSALYYFPAFLSFFLSYFDFFFSGHYTLKLFICVHFPLHNTCLKYPKFQFTLILSKMSS